MLMDSLLFSSLVKCKLQEYCHPKQLIYSVEMAGRRAKLAFAQPSEKVRMESYPSLSSCVLIHGFGGAFSKSGKFSLKRCPWRSLCFHIITLFAETRKRMVFLGIFK